MYEIIEINADLEISQVDSENIPRHTHKLISHTQGTFCSDQRG